MKEIKFRVWDKICNRFFNIDYNYPVTITNQGKIGVLVDDFNFEEFKKDELKNIIISEYTGLKDKNEKEIYEGDIVVWIDNGGNKRQNIVFFEQGAFRICNSYFEISEYGELEVVGNIYENKELLGN